MKKILITGSNGLLGSNLVRYFSQNPDYIVFSTSRSPSVNPPTVDFIQTDLLNSNSANKIFSRFRPDIVINTVSLVNVDQCEEDPGLANKLIVKTTENVTKSADRFNCRIIYISTDQIFDGKKSMYKETDFINPINVYGQTKSQAELQTLQSNQNPTIIRTNFFGWSPTGHIQTFGEWIFNSIKEKKPMNLFTDYYFTPIEITFLAEAIDTLISSQAFPQYTIPQYTGLFNIAGSQRCSKYDFGMCMGHELEKTNICEFDPTLITPTTLKSAKFKAPRPQDLSLSTEKFNHTFKTKLPSLSESIVRFCKTIPEGRNQR